ncbi:MAG: PhnD/SsuA/transferrin family substrate-binding protein [bacterium]
MRCYRRLVAVLLMATAGRAHGQEVRPGATPAPPRPIAELRFGYESSSEHSSADAKVDEAVLHLLALVDSAMHPDQVKQKAGSGTKLFAMPFSYETPCSLIRENAIAMLTPIKYLDCRDALGGKLIPLFVVEKDFVSSGYYSALMISDGGSNIKSLDSPNIKRLVLGSRNSTSGYVAPLFMLWQIGRIPTPTLWGARQSFEIVEPLADGRSVKDAIAGDPSAIGAVSEFKGDADIHSRHFNVLLRYDHLPETMLAVSANLGADTARIAAALEQFFERVSDTTFKRADAAVIRRSSVDATGVIRLSEHPEYLNAYTRLSHMRARVIGGRIGMSVWNGLSAFVAAACLTVALMITLFGGYLIGRVRRAAYAEPSHALGYLATVALGIVWFELLLYPMEPQWFTLVADIILSALMGTSLRRVSRQFAGESDDRAKPPILEAWFGLLVAFAFALVLLGGDSFFRGNFILPAPDGTIQRVSLIVALTSFGAAWLLEDAYRTLQRKVTQHLETSGGSTSAEPAVHAPQTGGYSAALSESKRTEDTASP